MITIWENSELWFSLLWITGYVAGNSLSAWISGIFGITHCATSIFNLSLCLVLFVWIRANGLMQQYGLCKRNLPAGRFLWYIPLAILASKNLWNGMALTLPIVDTIFSVCNMIGVGCLEELLFRGLLFQAVSQKSAKRGIVISSVSFGLAHIVNLINGRGMELAENVWQIILATAFGFLCGIILYRGSTLWPCILTHVALNVTSVFSKHFGAAGPVQTLQNLATLLLMIGYTWILTKTLPEREINPGCEPPLKT